MSFKTNNWNELPLYKKIKIYMGCLTRKKAKYTNKLIVKNIIKRRFPEIYLPKTIKILKSITDLTIEDVNKNYILKAVHASSWNIDLNLDNSIKKTIHLNNIKKQLQLWNKTYSLKERQYTYIQPQFYLEEKIED